MQLKELRHRRINYSRLRRHQSYHEQSGAQREGEGQAGSLTGILILILMQMQMQIQNQIQARLPMQALMTCSERQLMQSQPQVWQQALEL